MTTFDAAQSSKILSVFVPRKKVALKFQPEFDFLLWAANYKNVRVVVQESVVGFIVDKGWSYQNDVIKLASTRSPQLIYKVFGFARVCRAHDQLER